MFLWHCFYSQIKLLEHYLCTTKIRDTAADMPFHRCNKSSVEVCSHNNRSDEQKSNKPMFYLFSSHHIYRFGFQSQQHLEKNTFSIGNNRQVCTKIRCAQFILIDIISVSLMPVHLILFYRLSQPTHDKRKCHFYDFEQVRFFVMDCRMNNNFVFVFFTFLRVFGRVLEHFSHAHMRAPCQNGSVYCGSCNIFYWKCCCFFICFGFT